MENFVFFPWEFNSFRRKDNSDDSWIWAILCYFPSTKKHENSVFWILWPGIESRLHWKCKRQENSNSCEGFCRHISEQDLSFTGFLRNQTSKQQEKVQLPNIFIKVFSIALTLCYWEFFFFKMKRGASDISISLVTLISEIMKTIVILMGMIYLMSDLQRREGWHLTGSALHSEPNRMKSQLVFCSCKQTALASPALCTNLHFCCVQLEIITH